MSEQETSKCWSIVKTGEYYTIKLSGLLSDKELTDFEKAQEEIYKGPAFYNAIVHCGELSELPMAWAKSLLQLQKSLKATNKQLRLILATSTILNFLKLQGIDLSLPNSSTLRDALVIFGLTTKRIIDVEFINPFLSATMHVLKVQASTESTPGKISMKEDKSKYMGDISGVIGLVSDSFNGSVVISFPENTFLKIISRMLGEECKELNKDIQDGAAELTNMIFGQAKVTLNEKGYGLKTAIPSVVTGKNHSVQSLTSGPQVLIPFQTDVGEFFIEICTSG